MMILSFPSTTASSLVFFLFLLSSFKLGIHAARNTIMPGDIISINQTIVSPAGTFVLGFFNPGKSPTSYYLGIWFSVDDKAVVWVANRENALEDASGTLTLDAHGNLAILNRGRGIIWSSNSSAASNGTQAALSDSGNLMLTLGSNPIWQSFDHPTDTLLPDMKIVSYYRTGVGMRCVSWRTAHDPSPGNFSSGFDPRTSIQLFIWQGSEPYYRSTVLNGTSVFAVPVNETNGSIYVGSLTLDDEKISWRLTVSQDLGPTRLVQEETGFLTFFNWNAASHRWSMLARVPRIESSPCEFYNQCGFNAVCTGDQPTRSCKCLTGFVPKNLTAWDAVDFSSGCVREVSIDCNKGAQYVAYTGMKVPDGMTLIVDATKKECEANCSAKCNCTAYSFFDSRSPGSNTICLTWFGEMADLVQNSTANDELYVRVDASDLNHDSANVGSSNKSVRSLVIILPIGTILMLVLGITCCFRRMRHNEISEKYKRNVRRLGESTTSDTSGTEIGINDVALLDFHSIQSATDDFALANKIGGGGFGSVYKGRLEDGQKIAVKRLSENSRQGFDEFINEVKLIAKLQHTNLVKLLGWCVHRNERILIYEYMSNKSLDKYLFDSDHSMKLTWGMRLTIILGVAQGLLYLHRYSRVRIIHRDLKTSNILLDENMSPKISDFGLARIFGETQLEAETKRLVGTYGYMAPEYGLQGHFSEKSDVFSFGVMVLEIISGKRNKNSYLSNGSFNLLGYIWQLWAEERCVEIADPAMNCLFPISEVVKCVQVGLLCVQDLAKDRPTMDSVISMLGNKDPVLPSPRQPAFTLENAVTVATGQTICGLTMSTLEAR